MKKIYTAVLIASISTFLITSSHAQDCKPIAQVLKSFKLNKQNVLVKFCQEEVCTYYYKNPASEKAKPYIEIVANHEFMEDQQCAYEVNTLTTSAFKQIEKNYKAGKYDGDNEGE
ncbi:hypothetical protein [Bartonella sp. HY038]|uniref:hypothetical protein n=1 Tax=Bartonella sp. HY038 TaxID=2759660 RepID=UPI0015FCCF07|nr:hypothetical protein [Bartonella sp. HY038]